MEWKTVTISNSNGNHVIDKKLKFRSVEGLKDQLISSFSLGTEGPIEVIDASASIVALGDLEDGHKYYIPPIYADMSPDIAANGWSSNDLWQTKDPIHDMISLPDFCREIIDTPEFQRLRDVKQLGSCSYVYIGAHHSRFEHCIGTARLAFQMVCNLRSKQPELGITSKDVLCVTIAGLCHDLGHGPFSHVWDDAVFPLVGITDGRSHEQNSIDLFDAMIERLKKAHSVDSLDAPIAGLTDRDLVFIKAMIHSPEISGNSHDLHLKHSNAMSVDDGTHVPTVPSPTGSDGSFWDERIMGRPKSMKFLFEIVSNKRSGLDVDKFDYIQRDCHNTGVRGHFEADRVVLNATVKEADGDIQICWPDKELENLAEVFHSRESLHRRVYQHKVAKSCEIMIRDAFVLAAPHMHIQNESGDWLTFKEAQYDPSAFLHFSDWLVQLLVHGPHIKIDFNHPDLKKAQGILLDMHSRKLLKFVGSTNADIESNIEDCKQELSAFSGGVIQPHEWEIAKRMFSWGMGNKNPIENVVFVSKGGNVKKIRPGESSKMLPASFKESFTTVYIRKTDRASRIAAAEAFKKWCAVRGYKASSSDGTSLGLTDCRKRKRGSVMSDESLLTPRKRPSL